jgi:hypothetical protein
VTAIDPVYAQWLMGPGLWHVGSDAPLLARWGDKAQVSERMTTLADKAEAVAEAARQIAFLGGPLVIDEHVLAGSWGDRLGQVITITGDRLGYTAGIGVFVIGAEDDRATGLSQVTVLRRL